MNTGREGGESSEKFALAEALGSNGQKLNLELGVRLHLVAAPGRAGCDCRSNLQGIQRCSHFFLPQCS